jgi:radical SAM superfamily enzyme
LQDSNYACPTKEARAHDLACLIKEAKALDVKGINFKSTIIIETPIKGSNPIRGSKSRTICIDFISRIDLTSRINFTNREN